MKELITDALIVVDVQNDFCPGGTLAVPEGDKVVGSLNSLIHQGERGDLLVIFSRDWHPKNTSHFKEFGGIWPTHCVAGTEGAAFHPLLRFNEKLHTVISKGTGLNEDAYSAFDGKDQNGISLADILKDKGIKRVRVGGLALDYCVKATALDAARLGFETSVIEDATRAVNIKPDDGAKAIEELQKAGVKVETSTEVLSHYVVQTILD